MKQYKPADHEQYAAGERAFSGLKATSPAEYARIRAMGDEAFNVAILALGAAASQPVTTLADVPAFIKAERAAKYARWAKEEITKAVVEADDPPEEIRATAASFLADRLALSDGLTLMQVGDAHAILAEKLIAEIPLYAAGWTGADTAYFDDAVTARGHIVQALEAAANRPIEHLDQEDVAEWHILYAESFRNMPCDHGNDLTLFGTTYFVKKV